MATILSETKSTGGSPYAYYTVNATASDRTATTVKVKVDIIGRLSSSSAVLGTGSTMGLIGYITLHNTEHSITLKTTSEKWSGTTKHTKSATFTIEDLEGSRSQLTNIKFRVSRTGSAANDYTKGAAMSSKNCSNLQIGIGHTNPSDVSFTITEKKQKLIDAGIPNDTYVNNLSIKEYNINATLHDGATATDYNIYNGLVPSFNKSTPITIDYSQKELVTWNDTGKVPIRVQVLDNMGGNGYSSSAYEPTLYDYIPYLKISLNETTTTARRNGQTSGRVKLNINGTFYNGSVGNVTQTKPTIKYKYWSANATEPATFDNVIPSDKIIISNNNLSVVDYEIGSIDETASNYFNPDYAYRVKVYVEDNFTSYISQEKQIPVGEATWAEYKDRVDFKKITIQGIDALFYENGDIYQINNLYINVGGCITSAQKLLRFAIFTPKLLTNISSIVVNNAKLTVRHVGGGYLLNAQDVTSRLQAYKAGDNTIYLVYVSSSAMSATNNTPVAVEINNLKLTFKSA